MNQIPIDIPPGPRYPATRREAPVAFAENRQRQDRDRNPFRAPMQVAALPTPPTPPLLPRLEFASLARPQQQRGGFHLVAPAMAEAIPGHHGNGLITGDWAIQVGAFANQSLAHEAAESARARAHDELLAGRPTVGMVRQASATLYRARLTGLSREAATQACEKLAHGHAACIVLSPQAQS